MIWNISIRFLLTKIGFDRRTWYYKWRNVFEVFKGTRGPETFPQRTHSHQLTLALHVGDQNELVPAGGLPQPRHDLCDEQLGLFVVIISDVEEGLLNRAPGLVFV